MKMNKALMSILLIPQLTFAVDNLDYCRDLMNQVRETYGKAPLCVPVSDKNGKDVTAISGLVGLSDDMTPSHSYFYMTIRPDQLNGQYSYSQDELRQLITLVLMENKGVTKNQGAIINLNNAIQNLDNSYKNGVIDKKYHDSAVSNLEKAKKQFQ